MIKRFIAGAVCPRCAAMDKIRAWTNEQGKQVRDCVACGFNEALNDPPAPDLPANRMEARKQQADSAKAAVKEQPIKFYKLPKRDPKPGS
ncbi:YheV family putative zinc ribbon protein [Allohahella sp. A8]|uniref:YheV family putative zinc ribbon protein n=1 Tax=Allohahella sp. A8 TaxID=3141461 RepID=UPI000C0B3B18|nr:DNA-binding protein [Hahellaceae bacterium]